MNIRSTVQRQLVLEAVKKMHHPTAEDVYSVIAKEHPNISKATVYRNLHHLADGGHIRRVQLLDAAVRFDCILGSHYHAQCRLCGKVLDVQEEDCINNLGDRLSQEGFLIENREVLFRGVCRECQREKQA